MARSDNPSEIQVTDEQSTNGATDLDKLMTDMAFRGPLSLRIAVETAATNAKLPVSAFLKKVVADAVGYALPAEKTRAAMTEDEKKAKAEADKVKAKAERAEAKRLLDEQRKANAPQAAPQLEGQPATV